MNAAMTLLTALLATALLMTSSVWGSPAELAQRDVKRSIQHQPMSPHMEIADRLLKRAMDMTYETLEDLGASREDLERVQQKRSYIQTCYFQAISCY
ncbi:unnamed protein product [Lymnaea stagnalis]|uniref:Uncharacterized protein n=2 Tax=Lymnaea stagnalis TaxID=6523 RepID=A0AAV2I8D8_LYMST